MFIRYKTRGSGLGLLSRDFVRWEDAWKTAYSRNQLPINRVTHPLHDGVGPQTRRVE